MKDGERETERWRERDREMERERDREMERERDREMERERQRDGKLADIQFWLLSYHNIYLYQ